MGRKKIKLNSKNQIVSALDRLATTVKADDQTILIGNAGRTVKAGSNPRIVKRFATGVSRMARRMIPGRPGIAGAEHIGQVDPKAQRRMQKIAKKLARGRDLTPKPRRSRLPYLIALVLGLLAGGVYYGYQTIKLPDFKIVQTVESKYQEWFSNVSTTAPKTKRAAKWNHPGKTSKKVVRSGSKKSSRYSSVSRANKRGKYSKSSTSSKRITKRTPKSTKKKIWATKLAKLKKQSSSKYRKASYKYRKKSK